MKDLDPIRLYSISVSGSGGCPTLAWDSKWAPRNCGTVPTEAEIQLLSHTALTSEASLGPIF